MAKIRFENAKKDFNDIVVVKDLSLTINDGEFFTFVGPSGCGKSTILNIIAGLEPVTEGKIYFDDAVVNDLSPKERDVAMVFQSYALYPHMTVYENIAFPLRMKKIQKTNIDEEVKQVTSLLGLEDMLNKKPKELSGGQRQRVALGRAIIRRPKAFLMDEPLSNLDARLRVEMRTEMKKLHQKLKTTTVYVTHDQAEAMSLSDRIAVLHQGKIQQCGTPVEIYTKPANTFVAGFIGSPSMNFIKGTVKNLQPLQIRCNVIVITPMLESSPEKEDLIIGIRPEDILVSNEKSDEGMEVTVSVVEPAGAFNWVDFVWNGVKTKGTSKPESKLKPGDMAFIKFSVDKVIVFDAELEERL